MRKRAITQPSPPTLCKLLCAARLGRHGGTRLAAQTDLLGEIPALFGIVGRDHRVIGGQAPSRAVFLGRHFVIGAKIALEHLQLLAVFKADNVIRLNRTADGDRRLRLGLFNDGCFAQSCQRCIDIADECRHVFHRYIIVANMGCDDVAGQRDEGFRRQLLVIFHVLVGLPDEFFAAIAMNEDLHRDNYTEEGVKCSVRSGDLPFSFAP